MLNIQYVWYIYHIKLSVTIRHFELTYIICLVVVLILIAIHYSLFMLNAITSLNTKTQYSSPRSPLTLHSISNQNHRCNRGDGCRFSHEGGGGGGGGYSSGGFNNGGGGGFGGGAPGGGGGRVCYAFQKGE